VAPDRRSDDGDERRRGRPPEKLGFYAAHHVNELVIVGPRVHWLALTPDSLDYRNADRNGLIALGPAELAARIHWPKWSVLRRGGGRASVPPR